MLVAVVLALTLLVSVLVNVSANSESMSKGDGGNRMTYRCWSSSAGPAADAHEDNKL